MARGAQPSCISLESRSKTKRYRGSRRCLWPEIDDHATRPRPEFSAHHWANPACGFHVKAPAKRRASLRRKRSSRHRRMHCYSARDAHEFARFMPPKRVFMSTFEPHFKADLAPLRRAAGAAEPKLLDGKKIASALLAQIK